MSDVARANMTTYMQKEYEAALELEERPVLNEVRFHSGHSQKGKLSF